MNSNPIVFPIKSLLYQALVIAGITLLGSCQFFRPSAPASTPAAQSQTTADASNAIKKIYIQSFTGRQVDEVRDIFFNTIQEQDIFSFVELLPDNYQQLNILRVEVVDYNIWETDEELFGSPATGHNYEAPPRQMKRRNALVSIKISLFNAETGKLLLRKLFSQPYQQIYVGAEAIEERPNEQLELRRLTKILVFKILTAFYQNQADKPAMKLEQGTGHSWFSMNIHNLGDDRIQKGNRLALAGDVEKAIWMWKIVLFRPAKAEPESIYIQNRASAYYNLGIIFHQQKDWWSAAKMFSHANRIEQKLKYAQAWGDNMQLWLEQQRELAEAPQGEDLSDYPGTAAPSPPPMASQNTDKESKRNLVKDIEENDQYLLNPRELWPLDPYLKAPHLKETQNNSGARPSLPPKSNLELMDSGDESPLPAVEAEESLINEIPNEPVDLTE